MPDKTPSRSLHAAILVACAVALCTLDLYACASSLPNPLHCSSSLLLRTNQRSDVLTEYNVDEYLDIAGERSSLLVQDVRQTETKIYYNQLTLQGYADRKFLVYNPVNLICQPQAIVDWPLSELRKVAIHLYDLDSLRRDHVDVPIGPSVLLFAIRANARNFKFISTIFSKSRMSNVDVYGNQMRDVPLGGWLSMDLIVHVPTRMNRDSELKVGDTLDRYFESTGGPRAPIAMVGACRKGSVELTSSSLRRRAEHDDSGRDEDVDRPTSTIYYRDPSELDEDTFCEREQVHFIVRYNLLGEYQPGTLAGKGIVQLGPEYVFHREPFVQPVGIGCWGAMGEAQLAPVWQRSLGKSVAMNQLSGQFVTTRGARGSSFVAYDRERHLLRLDRNGRKSIYDLVARRAYHVGEFALGFDRSQEGQNELIDSCVALDMDLSIGDGGVDGNQPVTNPLLAGRDPPNENLSLLERLIGLSQDDQREHYLGTRTIDHVAYEVFERQWAREGEVPLLLQTNKYRAPPVGGDKRLYLTYYVRLDDQTGSSGSKFADSDSSQQQQQLMSVEFVEMWEFDTRVKRTVILNRLRFSEFSWSLDVAPTNDFELQSGSPTLRLFNAPPCYRDRTRQVELVVYYRQTRDSKKLDQRQVRSLRANSLEIGEELVKLIASTTQVSRLNVVDLQLDILPSGDMISTNKFVDLIEGSSELSQLGKLDLRQQANWSSSVWRVFHNRHSLEDCQLDSLAWPERNWFAYCPVTNNCLLLRRNKDELEASYLRAGPDGEPIDEQKPNSTSSSTKRPRDSVIVCTVYSLRYSQVGTAQELNPMRGAANLAELNAWLLARQTVWMKISDTSSAQLSTFNYIASPEVRQVRELDAIGARLANERASLTGLRHLTPSENSLATNMNQRVSVRNLPPADTPFRHCQLACQLDDSCASFSVCDGGRKSPGDCVLSSMRLNGERVATLVELAEKAAMPRGQFEMKVTGECESQVFVMHRDDSCSLHPRDFLADYRVVKMRFDSGEGGSSAGANEIRKVVTPNITRQVSLEECAGLSFELNTYEDPKVTNFTFCPLESQCFVRADEGLRLGSAALQGHGQCLVYAKRVSQAYEVRRVNHLSLVARAPREGSNQGQREPPRSAPALVGEPKPAEMLADDMESWQVMARRRFWGLSEESCARECNLHKSACLAFDSCRQAGRTLCLLYSVRSPLAGEGAYLPLTKLERETRAKADATLVSSHLCDHFHLKPAYFAVRLHQLLDREEALQSGSGGGEKNKLDQMESLIANSDGERAKQELEGLEGEYKFLQDDYRRKLASETSGSGWLHAIFLALGMGLGCLGALFKGHPLVRQSGNLIRDLPWPGLRAGAPREDLRELVRDDRLN